MKNNTPRIAVALIGAAIIYCPALAQQAPTPTIINELYERYKPRLPDLTPTMIGNIWRARSNDEPWFQRIYKVLNANKDNPRIIDDLRKQAPCAETNVLTRDATYSPAAKQYRCIFKMAAADVHLETVMFVNLQNVGALESAIVYQDTGPMLRANLQAKTSAEKIQFPAVLELHSDILSRIDNARAPSGGYVEYSKNMDRQKFAVRFR